MHSFTCFVVIASLATVAIGASVGSSQSAGPLNIQQTLTEETNLNAPSELARLKKSTYGGGAPSYSPPPCPKNYLFSCQPNLAPVPCAQQSYAAAYSSPVPTYALPNHFRGIPEELLRPMHNQYYY